jgi:hypothetical protein
MSDPLRNSEMGAGLAGWGLELIARETRAGRTHDDYYVAPPRIP